VSFATITLCVASQQVIPKVSTYFIIGSVQKLLDTPLYACHWWCLSIQSYLPCRSTGEQFHITSMAMQSVSRVRAGEVWWELISQCCRSIFSEKYLVL
jgi:hypothetical protein